jgi:thiol-disulfide isomerase/thioredoxin
MSDPTAPAPASSDPTPESAPASVRTRRGRGSRLPYAIALLVVAGLVAAAWLGRNRFEQVVAGQPAPGFRVTDLDGKPVTLNDYKGKVVLLNVWATWCAPCREEMPSMQRLYQAMQSNPDFAILAVSVDEPTNGQDVPKRDLEKFARDLQLTFPLFHSTPDGPDDIQKIYQTTGVPESFLIGKDGVIYRRFSGSTSWDAPEFREQINRLLAE